MRADHTNLKTLLEGVKQFIAPGYQRRYIWTQPQWEALWRQVLRQTIAVREIRVAQSRAEQPPARSTHFLGSFVLAPQPGPAAALTRHQIVDGQQRLTTLSVILAVLRDALSPDEAERLQHTYLVNQYKHGDDRPKVLLTAADRPDLLTSTITHPAVPSGLIGSAYNYFRNQLDVARVEHPDMSLDDLEIAVVTRLSVVEISTDSHDNVHRIFQTLNSSGVKLDQVDLLRNHFFMLLPTLGDEIYQNLWLPMEQALGLSGLDDFFFVDVVRRLGRRERYARHDVYRVYQEELEPVENQEPKVAAVLHDIQRRAEIYRQILDPTIVASEAVRHRLALLNEWGTTTVHPLLLEILLRLATDRTDAHEAAAALKSVESYLARRLLLRIPTNNLNRIMSEVPSGLPQEGSLSASVRAALSAPGRYWPTDDDIRGRIASEEFYRAQRPAQRQFVLRRLEESLPHEVPPDWDAANLTLEHVMPQTLTEDWFTYLGMRLATDGHAVPETALEMHARLVHSIGNITLSAYNPELGAKPFDEKKALMFDGGPLELNRRILETPEWDAQAIEERSEGLGEMAIQVWPGPAEGAGGAGAVDSWSLVEAALLALPGGRWTTYAELSELSDIPAVEIRGRLSQESPPGAARRVMTSDGRIDALAPWARENVAAYRQQLVADGILPSGSANEALAEAFVGAAELSDLIGES